MHKSVGQASSLPLDIFQNETGKMSVLLYMCEMMLLPNSLHLISVAPSAKSEMPLPSVSKSLFASLAGNVCSAVAFPLLMILVGWIVFSIEKGISD
jgi:hypothetical protein